MTRFLALALLLVASSLRAQYDLTRPEFLAQTRAGPTGPFTPSQAPGIALWLKSDTFTTNDTVTHVLTNGVQVTNWTDQVFGLRFIPNDGGGTLTNLNGSNAVFFAGTGAKGMVANSTHVADSPTDLSIYIVAALESSVPNSSWFTKGASDGNLLLLVENFTTASGYATTNSFLASGFAPVSCVLTYIFSSTSGASMYTNGVAMVLTNNPYIQRTINGTLTLNFYYTGAPSMKGRYGEFILYTNAHGTADRNNVEKYLATKWGYPHP